MSKHLKTQPPLKFAKAENIDSFVSLWKQYFNYYRDVKSSELDIIVVEADPMTDVIKIIPASTNIQIEDLIAQRKYRGISTTVSGYNDLLASLSASLDCLGGEVEEEVVAHLLSLYRSWVVALLKASLLNKQIQIAVKELFAKQKLTAIVVERMDELIKSTGVELWRKPGSPAASRIRLSAAKRSKK